MGWAKIILAFALETYGYKGEAEWYHWQGRLEAESNAILFVIPKHYRSTKPVDITQETPKQTNITRGDCLLDVKSIPLTKTSKDF